jgi:hypothetical protein
MKEGSQVKQVPGHTNEESKAGRAEESKARKQGPRERARQGTKEVNIEN